MNQAERLLEAWALDEIQLSRRRMKGIVNEDMQPAAIVGYKCAMQNLLELVRHE